ncbi:glycosyltransferase family 4 protein [Streptomyces boncukensis]|uniref:Glycosyltransferase family 4 protein n=1 Tax=Streptomyces boncukensis TaxID=2711219 RepID=A0A6G4X2Y8_9ACTN|nr:glycosyltransferase family 4 protein [Streptomyces boncukensis]NGO71250.1 glycosyltransferase family 4 protein [Streptomyces boncukensis]
MIDVLLVASDTPRQGAAPSSVAALRARGARVLLAGYVDPSRVPPELLGVELLRLPWEDPARPQATARRLWRHTRRDAALRRRARAADVLVALDPAAVYTVWQLAQRNVRADAVHGLAPALRAVEARAEGAAPGAARLSPRTAVLHAAALSRRVGGGLRGGCVRALRFPYGRRVLRTGAGARTWRYALAAPGIPDELRARAARTIARRLRQAGRPTGAALALHGVARRVRGPQLRGELLADAAAEDLRAGRDTARVPEGIASALSAADRHHAQGAPGPTAAALLRALSLLFHRQRHLDALSSPLADDPEGYLRPWRNSRAARAALTPRGRAAPAAPPPSGRPLRLLTVTSGNANFMPLLQEHLAADARVETRALDLSEHQQLRHLTAAPRRQLETALSGGDTEYGRLADRLLRPYLDWADTVFVEWCAAQAGLVTAVDPGTARIVVRLHSYELFTPWPQLTDFSRVDDVVFIAGHVRDLAREVVPALDGHGAPHGPRLHTLHNALDLSGFARPKDGAARFTLGLVGATQVVKDPHWAMEVIRLLRRHDQRYRLLIASGPLNPRVGAGARAYHGLLERDFAELEPSGAVHRLGPCTDMPATFTRIGVVLSSSVREGSHCAVMEGAASGAVPVVRDWPFFAQRPTGARTFWPAEWVVRTPEEAAERVLALTGSEETWRAAGRAAARHAHGTWDWPRVRPTYERLLFSTEEVDAQGGRNSPHHT